MKLEILLVNGKITGLYQRNKCLSNLKSNVANNRNELSKSLLQSVLMAIHSLKCLLQEKISGETNKE